MIWFSWKVDSPMIRDSLILVCHDKWFLFLAPNIIMFLINNKCRGDSGPEAKLRQPILNHQHICFISVKKKKEKKKRIHWTQSRDGKPFENKEQHGDPVANSNMTWYVRWMQNINSRVISDKHTFTFPSALKLHNSELVSSSFLSSDMAQEKYCFIFLSSSKEMVHASRKSRHFFLKRCFLLLLVSGLWISLSLSLNNLRQSSVASKIKFKNVPCFSANKSW